MGVPRGACARLEGDAGARDSRRFRRGIQRVETNGAGEILCRSFLRRLLKTVAPRFDEINAELAALSELRDKPAGTVRITADEYAVNFVLWPALRKFLPQYPDINVEIVAERYDAGVRAGGIIAKDMVAVPIAPELRMVAVAAPAYLASKSTPRTPQELTNHRCINLRLPTHGGLYAWEFEKGGRELRVRVECQLVFNSITPILYAALDGFGIVYLPQDQVQTYLDDSLLLSDWSPLYVGLHLYYPSRRQPTSVFALVVEALRYRKPQKKR